MERDETRFSCSVAVGAFFGVISSWSARPLCDVVWWWILVLVGVRQADLTTWKFISLLTSAIHRIYWTEWSGRLNYNCCDNGSLRELGVLSCPLLITRRICYFIARTLGRWPTFWTLFWLIPRILIQSCSGLLSDTMVCTRTLECGRREERQLCENRRVRCPYIKSTENNNKVAWCGRVVEWGGRINGFPLI